MKGGVVICVCTYICTYVYVYICTDIFIVFRSDGEKKAYACHLLCMRTLNDHNSLEFLCQGRSWRRSISPSFVPSAAIRPCLSGIEAQAQMWQLQDKSGPRRPLMGKLYPK